MQRNPFIVTVAGVLLAVLLTTLSAKNKSAGALEQPSGWEYRIALLGDLAGLKDPDNEDYGKTLTNNLNELGRERWEFVHEEKGAINFWLFRRPAKNP